MKVVSLNDQTIICELENKDEETILKKFLTYDDNSAAFSRGGYDITKVKKAKLYKIIKEKYLVTYAGMTREIVQKCKEKGIKINDFVDKRTHFKYQKEEFDYVLNVGKVKEHDYAYIEDEMSQMVAVARKANICCKVIKQLKHICIILTFQ